MLATMNVVLAAEGSIIFVIVLIISVISWIVNLVQGNNPKGKPGNRPRPANQGQSELEKFLQSVVGNKPEPQQEPPRRPQQQQKQRPKNQEKKSGKPKPPAAERPAQRPATAERPGQRLAQTHLASTVGAGIRSNVEADVQRDLGAGVQHNLAAAVRQDMGLDGTTIAARQMDHPLIQALRKPQEVRQAIILAEILGRPKSLR